MRFTSNLPGDLYTPAECVEQVEYFTQQIKKKFNSEYGPDVHNERLEVLEFLYLVEKFLEIFYKNSFITTPKVKAAKVRAVIEENTEDSTQDSNLLKPNEEKQETKQFDMDMAVAEEYIEYYADKYKELTRKHKFAMSVNILIKINDTMP